VSTTSTRPGPDDVSTRAATLRCVSDVSWLTPQEQYSWHAFVQMQEMLRSRLEQGLVSRSSLSAADYTVLAVLSEEPRGRMRPFDLSRTLGWEKSRLHHQLTRMCRRGLVEKRSDPDSGSSRAVQVAITPRGRAAINEAAPGHVQDVRQLVLDALTDEQVAQLGAISRAILGKLTTD
jgi:DNA-binding MarR family transcriptional regulator